MGHMLAQGAYKKLRERLDRFPVGAPGQSTIYEILKIIYSPEEAFLASKLPLRFSSLKTIARKLKMSPSSLQPKLEALADKGLVLDFRLGDKMRYMLTPTITGFFEFSMMRIRKDIDQPGLATALHRYLVEERDFADSFKPDTQTAPFRTLIHEQALCEDYTEVLDWERASYLVSESNAWSVGLCHCRHVAQHTERTCKKFKLESCLTIGTIADYVARHGFGSRIERSQALDLLEQSKDAGLVHLCDNVQRKPYFICNCCGCCCEVLLPFKKFRLFTGLLSSSFQAEVDVANCNGCKKCHKACPVQAVSLIERPRTLKGKRIKWLAEVELDLCLGCGVCALSCNANSIQMQPRAERRIAPESAFAKMLSMAIEQGKLHELLIDVDSGMIAQAAHVLLAAVLKLPPAKQLLANQTFKSRCVDFMIQRSGLRI